MKALKFKEFFFPAHPPFSTVSSKYEVGYSELYKSVVWEADF